MWFRRLVGVVMIVTLLGANSLIVAGLLSKKSDPLTNAATSSQPAVQSPPTVTITANPGSIAARSTSGLSWETTGNATECTASGSWSGQKTPFGSESTGRIQDVGDHTYTITCSNAAGSAQASVTVAVTAAAPAASTTAVSKSQAAAAPATNGATYCSGRLPCYGPADVAAHGSAGNCWGYNGDRVINLSGFDSGFHQAKTGISTIQIGGLCGGNLAAALAGSVEAEGQSHSHNQTTKNNSDKNELPYFVGYYDASK